MVNKKKKKVKLIVQNKIIRWRGEREEERDNPLEKKNTKRIKKRIKEGET